MDKKTFDLVKYVKNRNQFRIIALGFTGSGKSWFVQKLVSAIQKGKSRNIIMSDTMNEGKQKLWQIDCIGEKGLFRRIISINLNGKKYTTPLAIAEYSASVAFECNPSILYIEELPDVISKNENISSSHPNVYRCLQQGRKKHVGVIVVSQMFTQTNNAFFNQATDIFVFAMSSKECREFEKWYGLDSGSINFNIPDLEDKPIEKLSKTEKLDLFCFYRITPMRQIYFYNPIAFKVKGRPKTKKKKNIEPELSE